MWIPFKTHTALWCHFSNEDMENEKGHTASKWESHLAIEKWESQPGRGPKSVIHPLSPNTNRLRRALGMWMA